MVNVGLAPFCGAEDQESAKLSDKNIQTIESLTAEFEKQAPAWGIDLKDPEVKMQYQRAVTNLTKKFLKKQFLVPTGLKPETFAKKIAALIKKIKSSEEELIELEQKVQDYRINKTEKTVILKNELEERIAELEDTIIDLHMQIKTIPAFQSINYFHDSFVEVGGSVINIVVMLSQIDLSKSNQSPAFKITAALMLMRLLMSAILYFKDVASRSQDDLRIYLAVPFLIAKHKTRGALLTSRYMNSIRTELKKLLEPSEQRAAEEILAYAENYGCNVLKDTMQGKPAPKYRIATEPKPTQPSIEPKLRIAPEPSTPSAAEVDAAALENQAPATPLKKALLPSK